MAPVETSLVPYSFSHISKIYKLYAGPRDRFLEALTGRPRHAAVHALNDVSGSIGKGSVLGIIGENGAGKSTLLKILTGTTSPTSGEIHMPGRIASILELGSSFHPEETGRRNVVLQAALAGLSRAQVEAALPEIEAFAELGDFFDRPVKTYSSGMQMRLAFSVATTALPDVVILDEALAVGDGRFQKKCVDRIFELKTSGRTILFCSHAMYYVTTLCDTAIWLDAGKVAAAGDSQRVVLEYERFLAGKERVEAPAVQAARAAQAAQAPLTGTHGRFLAVRVLGADGQPKEEFRPGEPWAVEMEFMGDEPSRALHVHVEVSTRDQVVCFAANSLHDGSGPFSGRERYRVRVELDALPLGKGEFVAHTYLGDERALALYDVKSNATFRVESDVWRAGLMSVPTRWRRVGEG